AAMHDGVSHALSDAQHHARQAEHSFAMDAFQHNPVLSENMHHHAQDAHGSEQQALHAAMSVASAQAHSFSAAPNGHAQGSVNVAMPDAIPGFDANGAAAAPTMGERSKQGDFGTQQHTVHHDAPPPAAPIAGQLWFGAYGTGAGNPDGHSDVRVEHADSDGQ